MKQRAESVNVCTGALRLKQSLSAAHTLGLHPWVCSRQEPGLPSAGTSLELLGIVGEHLPWARGEVHGEGRDENIIWTLLFSVEVQNSFFAVNSY